MVAPIALFPDNLIAQVLAASTYPDEVTAASTWLRQNPSLKDGQLIQAVDQQDWDASVKGLTQFPDVLNQMASNLPWTSALGHAYFNVPRDVMIIRPILLEIGCPTLILVYGKTEILQRRVGTNKNDAIEILHSLVDAQREYASEPRDGDTAKHYALKFLSDEGKQNGLYWKTAGNQPESPIGPLLVSATNEGYQMHQGEPSPFHGYYYRILAKHGSGRRAAHATTWLTTS